MLKNYLCVANCHLFIHTCSQRLLELHTYVIQTSTTKSSNLTVSIGYKTIALIVKALIFARNVVLSVNLGFYQLTQGTKSGW